MIGRKLRFLNDSGPMTIRPVVVVRTNGWQFLRPGWFWVAYSLLIKQSNKNKDEIRKIKRIIQLNASSYDIRNPIKPPILIEAVIFYLNSIFFCAKRSKSKNG